MVHLLLVSPCGLLVGVALGVGVVGVGFAAGGAFMVAVFLAGGCYGSRGIWGWLWFSGVVVRGGGGVMDFRHFSDIS